MKADTCPGCSRHCKACCPKCKYGRSYFEKQRKKEEKAGSAGEMKQDRKKKKWEKRVVAGGTAWMLVRVGGRMKKALRGGVREDALLMGLSEEERAAISAMLRRIDQNIAREG